MIRIVSPEESRPELELCGNADDAPPRRHHGCTQGSRPCSSSDIIRFVTLSYSDARGSPPRDGRRFGLLPPLTFLRISFLHPAPKPAGPRRSGGGRRLATCRARPGGGPHPKGWNEVEEPRSGLRDGGPRPEGSAAHSRDRRAAAATRPEEHSAGQEGVRRRSPRWQPYKYKKKKTSH